jgi:hypothetical protein
MTTTYKHKLFEKQQPRGQDWIRSLMPSDGKSSEVFSTMCIVPELKKKPEQAGWFFSKLQLKHWKLQMKAQLKAGITKDQDGNQIVLEDSEEELADSKANKNEKWVPKKTREQFIKCALNEDYYGVLDLIPFTHPFYSEDEIEKQYRR